MKLTGHAWNPEGVLTVEPTLSPHKDVRLDLYVVLRCVCERELFVCMLGPVTCPGRAPPLA